MPLYSFECSQGHVFDRYVKLVDFSEAQYCPECRAVAVRRVCAPFIAPDIQGYTSPVSGKWISSRTQRREDLRANSCVEWEPGFRAESARRRRQEEEAFDRSVEETIEREIAAMPVKARDRLAGEMEAGITAEVTRKEISNAP